MESKDDTAKNEEEKVELMIEGKTFFFTYCLRFVKKS